MYNLDYFNTLLDLYGSELDLRKKKISRLQNLIQSGSPSEFLSMISVTNDDFNLNSVIRDELRKQSLIGNVYSLTTGTQTVVATNFLVCQTMSTG